MANETWYRIKQVEELVYNLKKSTADAIILGGDLNASPILKKGKTIYTLFQFSHLSILFKDILAHCELCALAKQVLTSKYLIF